MTTVIDSTQQNTKIKPKKDALAQAEDLAFKLLITQLKCQDLDSAIDTNQMVQNLYQMNQLQTLKSIEGKIQQLQTSMNDNMNLSVAHNVIGKYAVIKDDNITVEPNVQFLPINYMIDSFGEHNATLKLLDRNNQIAYQTQLENIQGQKTNAYNLQFQSADGQQIIPEGQYKVQILANTKDNAPLYGTIFTSHKVTQSMMDNSFLMSNGVQVLKGDILTLQNTQSAVDFDYKWLKTQNLV